MATGWLIVAAALGQAAPDQAPSAPVPVPIPYGTPHTAPVAVTANSPTVVPAAAAGPPRRRLLPGVQRPPELTQLRALDERSDPAPAPPEETSTPPPANTDRYATIPVSAQPASRGDQRFGTPPAMASFTALTDASNTPPAITASNQPGSTSSENQPREDKQPWFALAVASFVLFLSLGSNLYLGWLTWSFRERCRRLAGQLRRIRFGSQAESP